MLLLCSPAGSGASVQPGDDFNANAATAAEVLQQWYNRRGLWTTTDWWNAANCVEAIESAVVANNGEEHLPVLERTFTRNSARNFLNEFYDDEGWWALAWIRAFDLSGETRYLEMARVIFADMAGGWDDHCGGGIWWKKDRKYKNAIANELFLAVAIKLHQRTPGDGGPGSYIDWARREWDWFRETGMINSGNLINDGLNDRCENNGQTTWTYNQGVILSGLVDLYKVTGDSNHLVQAEAIADAVLKTLTYPGGVLKEHCEPDHCGGPDVPQFKGIFVRYLADLYDVTRKPDYHQFLVANARSIWRNNRDAGNRFGFRWSGPIDAVDAASHSSAMMPIAALAEPMTKELPFIKGSGGPAFNHEVGAATGVLAWRCDSSAGRAGFMQWGPYVTSLGSGEHRVQFRMAVNGVSNSEAALMRLDVRENDDGTVLAQRDVSWKEFLAANESQAFALSFTNVSAASPLEFRVHWNHAPGAPAVTLLDVAVTDATCWSAANLSHEVGRLDGANLWAADPIRDGASGFLAKGAVVRAAKAGAHAAVFELKVDNFNRDASKVATLFVRDADTGEVVGSRDLFRKDFKTVLIHSFDLDFEAKAGRRYEFQTYWHFAPGAPRLTLRSVLLRRPESHP